MLLLLLFFGLSSRATASRSPALPTETNQTPPIPSYSCRQRGSRLCSADVEAKSGQAGARRRDAPSSRSAPGPRVEQGRTFIPFPPTRCRRIPPACRGNSNGSTVSISAVDHHQRKREKKHVESFIFFQTTSTSLASLRTERVCVCFVLNETRLRRLNHSVFDSQAAVLQPPLLRGANCQHAVSLCVCWDGETTARSPSPIATVACFVCEWVTRGANLFSK